MSAIPFGRKIPYLEGKRCFSCNAALDEGHGYHHDHVLDYFRDYINSLNLSHRDTQIVIEYFVKSAIRYMRFRTCAICSDCNAKDGHLKSSDCLAGHPAVINKYFSCKAAELYQLVSPSMKSLKRRITYGKKLSRKYERDLQRRMNFGKRRIDCIVARL